MDKLKTDKGRVIDDSFRREAVRLLVTSGRTIKEVADDLGVGVSSLGAWKRKFARAELMSGPHEDVEKEVLRLRRENELLRAERDLLKKATAFFWTAPGLVESHSLFLLVGVELGFERRRADVAEARVSAVRIVESLDVLANSATGFGAGREGRAPDQLGLERLEHGLDRGIVVAVAAPAHRRDKTMAAHEPAIICRAILAATIRMVNQTGRWLPQVDRAL